MIDSKALGRCAEAIAKQIPDGHVFALLLASQTKAESEQRVRYISNGRRGDILALASGWIETQLANPAAWMKHDAAPAADHFEEMAQCFDEFARLVGPEHSAKAAKFRRWAMILRRLPG